MIRALNTLLLVVSVLISRSTAAETAAKSPNVILIVADDFGWTDLACYGSDFYQSPNIDKLARDGMRFTANYSACTVCSPMESPLVA